MMDAGKILIGTAMLVFSVALLVTPPGTAFPDSFTARERVLITTTAGTCQGQPYGIEKTSEGNSSATPQNGMSPIRRDIPGSNRICLQTARAFGPDRQQFPDGVT